MKTVTVSSNYKITVPKPIRKFMGIKPGQKIKILAQEGLIKLIPIRPIKKIVVFLSKIDTNISREQDRDF
jgi:AbrB family looped-hinge helix DNA binding protein